ncbi:MAG: hypothetical protein ACRYGG_12485 [Janthinobacterium lividum]
MRKAAIFTLLAAMATTAGCAEQHKLAQCKGSLVVLNSTHWQPSASDVAALDKLCPEDK